MSFAVIVRPTFKETLLMRQSKLALGVLLPTALFISTVVFAGRPQSVPQPSNAQNPASSPTPSAASPQTGDKIHEKTVQETNDAFAADILQKIKGHEQEPAGKVFKNVKWLVNVPASNLLTIMNFGYSRALGVTCTHCHNENDFSSDEKRPKRAAREMQVMHKSINDQLSKMENLQPRPDHFINCSTCHRGMLDPRQQIPAKTN